MNIKRLIIITSLFACCCAGMAGSNKIDRKALVMRHNVMQTQIDKYSPLSVGNGCFCYTADITGMQTFPELYRKGSLYRRCRSGAGIVFRIQKTISCLMFSNMWMLTTGRFLIRSVLLPVMNIFVPIHIKRDWH